MKTLLHLSVIFYGIFEIAAGLLKLITGIPEFTLTFLGMYMSFICYNSIVYIILINLIGGGITAWYAWYTMKDRSVPQDPKTRKKKTTPAENISSIATLYITGVSLWGFAYMMVLLSSFDGQIMPYLPLFIFCLVFFIPKSLLPIILVYVNNISKPKKKIRPY